MRHPGVIAWVAATLIRLLGRTLRVRVDDRCGLTRGEIAEPLIWLFWHNRVLIMPYLQKKVARERQGKVLTSPSKDGEIIAQIMERFGHGAIRGSSNKRPAAALREMVREIQEGRDMVITPDGPRGPRYVFQKGAIKLAQLSGAPLMPVHLRYGAAWRLKTWDGFVIPRPFTTARLTVGPLVRVPRKADAAALEAFREGIEREMVRGAETNADEAGAHEVRKAPRG